MTGRLFYLLALSCLIYAQEDTLDPCTAISGEKYYDLRGLASKKDYTTTSATGRTFTLNVCQPVINELWNIQDDAKQDTVGAFYRGDRSDMSIGTANVTLTISQDNPLLVLTDGSLCPHNDKMRASTMYRFICDPSVYFQGAPKLLTQLPPEDDKACAFVFEWRTRFACPTVRRTGAGGLITVFSSILFVALLVYLVGATLYNRYVLGHRGLNQLPVYSSISSSSFASPGPATSSFAELFRTIIYTVQDKFDDWRSGGYRASSTQWGSWGDSGVGRRSRPGWGFRDFQQNGEYNPLAYDEQQPMADNLSPLSDADDEHDVNSRTPPPEDLANRTGGSLSELLPTGSIKL